MTVHLVHSREAMDDSISEATENNHQRRRCLASYFAQTETTRSKNNDDDCIRHTERQRASRRRQNESPERRYHFVDNSYSAQGSTQGPPKKITLQHVASSPPTTM